MTWIILLAVAAGPPVGLVGLSFLLWLWWPMPL